ncbi:flagellar protein FlhE [Pseudomonas sp. DTU_2021_1001937_2_SI_NGA_ILE_001]|uniref:flagellar protein FlhE n=1 Tax=Pseudomonas sp. DTU_2021_1001937_2_SI_NGA_ILE_001 TaxID=3077589 RepID=UPI0028FC1DCC|nr:flagellar protein FlhE [Pseudomonas sp. DTU_2021_1001937_2_SI_NGA_ILE_001]WNW14344.1 flagellar protein FlhE [Pseudomonas sp. DTU_2021_1001937_2_SI_NGA_ILE_001]
MLGSLSSAQAANYSASVILPTVHSKGYLYKAVVPVMARPAAGAVISDVSWTWNVVGWPNYLQVSLCIEVGHCLDVSRQRSGSTRFFAGRPARQPLYFTIRMSPSGLVPVAGQQAQLTVNW